MNRIRHSINNSVWGLLYRILHMIFPMIFRAVIIRTIGITYVGLDGLFKSILNVLTLSELGFGSAVIYMMYKPIAEGDTVTLNRLLNLLRKVYKWIGVFILVIGIALVPFLKFLVNIDTGVDVNYYVLYGLYLFHTVMSYWMFSYRSALFTAHQEYEINFKIMVSCSLVQYAIQAMILVTLHNYYLYLAVFAFMIIPENILYNIISKKKYPDLKCEGKALDQEVETLKIKVFALIGHRIGNTVIFSIDSVIISAFIGVTKLAQYDNYNLILLSVVTLLSIFYTSTLASVGNKISTDTVDNVYSLFKRLSFLWIGLIMWATACLMSMYQPFIALWVGAEYLFEDKIVICIALYFFVWQFRQIGLIFKDAAGLWERDKIKPYIGMTANVLLSIFFVKETGSIVGVLLPTMAILLLLYFPWETWVLFKYLFCRSSKEYIKLILRFIATSLSSVFLAYMLCSLLHLTGIIGILVNGLICTLFAPLLYVLLNINTPQLKECILIARKLRNRGK